MTHTQNSVDLHHALQLGATEITTYCNWSYCNCDLLQLRATAIGDLLRLSYYKFCKLKVCNYAPLQLSYSNWQPQQLSYRKWKLLRLSKFNYALLQLTKVVCCQLELRSAPHCDKP